jgi:hypothetical protein
MYKVFRNSFDQKPLLEGEVEIKFFLIIIIRSTFLASRFFTNTMNSQDDIEFS